MKNELENDILGTLQETMDGLHRIGVVDKITMRQFKEICDMPEVPEYSADEIRLLRQRYNISQSVLAWLVNVSPTSVQKWEQGVNCPNGPALKLLNLLDRKGVDTIQ